MSIIPNFGRLSTAATVRIVGENAFLLVVERGYQSNQHLHPCASLIFFCSKRGIRSVGGVSGDLSA